MTVDCLNKWFRNVWRIDSYIICLRCVHHVMELQKNGGVIPVEQISQVSPSASSSKCLHLLLKAVPFLWALILHLEQLYSEMKASIIFWHIAMFNWFSYLVELNQNDSIFSWKIECTRLLHYMTQIISLSCLRAVAFRIVSTVNKSNITHSKWDDLIFFSFFLLNSIIIHYFVPIKEKSKKRKSINMDGMMSLLIIYGWKEHYMKKKETLLQYI